MPSSLSPRRGQPSVLRRNLRLGVWEGMAGVPLVFLAAPANFVVAALLTGPFGLRESVYSVILALPAWFNVVQALTMPLLARRFSTKSLTLCFTTAHLLSWAFLAVALPWLPRSPSPLTGPILIAIFAFSTFCQAHMNVSWNSWVQEWTPRRIRAGFFGTRNRTLQVCSVLYLWGVGELLHRSGGGLAVYQFILLSASALRLISVYGQYRVMPAGADPARPAARPLREQLQELRRARGFLGFAAFNTAMALAASLFWPFAAVFMIRHLRMRPDQISLIPLLTSVTSAIAFPVWGRLMDRHGSRPALQVALLFYSLPNLLWFFLTPDNFRILYGMAVIGGISTSGYFLGVFNLQLKLVPLPAKTLALSLSTAAGAVMGGIGPILGGQIITALESAGHDPLRVYQTVFLVPPVLVLLCLSLLRRIEEPRATSLTQLIGSMRSLRQLGAMLGLGYFPDYLFFRKNPRPDPERPRPNPLVPNQDAD